MYARPPKRAKQSLEHNSEIVTIITEKKGVKRGLEALVPDLLQQYLHQSLIGFFFISN